MAFSINPTTEELLGEFKELNEPRTVEEVKKSRNAFLEWKGLEIVERVVFLKKASSILKKNSRKYGELITKEMGKPIRQSIAEVEKCALTCEFYAENADDLLCTQEIKTDAKRSYITYEPLGTILGIMPWNFPFWQVFRFAAGTMVAGNTIVVKHASNVPQCAIAIEEVFREANLPENVYKNLTISSKTVASLVNADLVDGLSLTGSTEAGSKVGGLAGKNLKRVVLELGGNDPFIVLEDANIEKSARTAVTARFQSNGQSCVAAKRFLLHQKIAEEFKERFLELVEKMVVGDPMDQKTDLGPLARADMRETLEKQLNE
ncbi:aldehyde dehydrogenase family protein, partial [Candidatus Micrarchaeota archaeon]|nr:aldehyde dehydrogenase family protein [Candidatus Micrarchaeota archaeon]